MKKSKEFHKKSGKVKSDKIVYVLNEKEKLILLQLKINPEGLRASTIQKLTNIPLRTVYRILNKYLEKELVESVNPLWKKNNGYSDFWQTLLKNDELFELHNLGYVLRLMKVPDWWNKRKVKLMKLKGWQFTNNNFGKNNSNPFQQLVNDNFVVQTYPESIIIISRKRYYARDPYETIQEGMSDVLDLIEYLEERFRFKFFPDGIPSLELRANDFNRMKDYLATRCKKDGTRFLVKTPKGKVWVDYSEPIGRESNTPDIQQTLERDIRDKIMNKPMLNSELQSIVTETATQINQVTQNQSMFNKNFESHVSAIQSLDHSAKANSISTELLANSVREMKDSFKEQIEFLREEIRK